MAATALLAAGVLIALLVPALAAAEGGARRALAAAGGILLAVAAVAGMAALPLAGFALALAGAARLGVRLGAPRALAAGGLALAGCGLLVLPFLGDALVEARGPGRESRAAVAGLLDACPTAAAVGGGLGVDFLRAPRAYGSAGREGLSRIGPFYAYRYPRPLASAAGFGALGAVLFGLSALAPVRPRP